MLGADNYYQVIGIYVNWSSKRFVRVDYSIYFTNELCRESNPLHIHNTEI